MRDKEQDEQWLRNGIAAHSKQIVYITPNHYDGGYEIRVDTLDFFIDYETIDANDTTILAQRLATL